MDITVGREVRNARVEAIRGGGSVWNILMNAAMFGEDCVAFGAQGDDWRGGVAASELSLAGIKTEPEIQIGRVTQSIFQMSDTQQTLLNSPRWKLSPTCPACERRVNASRLARYDAFEWVDRVSLGDYVCFDRVTKHRVESAERAVERGANVALDLGHRGFVRFAEPRALRRHLKLFHLVQAPTAVMSAIASRISVPLTELPTACGNVWIATDGPMGARVIGGRRRGGQVHIDPPHVEVVDPIGAGDALLGGILARLHSSRVDLRRVDTGQIADVASSSLGQVADAISHVGARGHLVHSSQYAPALRFVDASLELLRRAASDDPECPLCGSTRRANRKRPTVSAKSNLNYLTPRVTAALAGRSAVRSASDWLQELSTTVVCGTGGSFPVAQLVATMMRARGGFALALHPADYLSIPPAVDRVLAISYSGTNHDLELVLRHAIESDAKRVGIVTINPQPRIADLGTLDTRVELICYGSEGLKRERGFVSIAATIMPAAVWVAAECGVDAVMDGVLAPVSSRESLNAAARTLMESAEDHLPIEVFATGWARPAALDLESKMTESATAVVRIHDVKDFSHGRFLSTIGSRNRRLVLSVGAQTRYLRKLASVLNEPQSSVVELHFPEDSALGAFHALLAVQHVAATLANLTGRDLSRPEAIPPSGLHLYRWRGDIP